MKRQEPRWQVQIGQVSPRCKGCGPTPGVTVSRPIGGVLCLPFGSGGHPSKRPTWGLLSRADGPPMSHAWPCSGWGLPSRPGHPGRWCALTAPFHPYLCGQCPPSAVCFLWHFPAGHPDWPLASTLPCGAPTFLDPVPCGPGRGHPAGSPSRQVCQARYRTCSCMAIASARWAVGTCHSSNGPQPPARPDGAHAQALFAGRGDARHWHRLSC